MSFGWTWLANPNLEPILDPVLTFIVLAPTLIIILVLLLAFRALWEARTGPGTYWSSFRRCFATGWRSHFQRILWDLADFL